MCACVCVCECVHLLVHVHPPITANTQILSCLVSEFTSLLVRFLQNLHMHLMSSDMEVLQQGIMDEHILLLWGQEGVEKWMGQQGWGKRGG